MMKNIGKGLVLALFIVMNVTAQEAKWRFVKEAHGIKVYYRDIPKHNLNEVKIQTTFNTNLSTIVEALRDVETYPNWVYKASSSKIIKRFGDNEMIYYNRLDFPWPLSDRDIAIRTKIVQNSYSKEVVSVSYAEPLAVKRKGDLVRIEEFNSMWTFRPVDGHVEGEYVFKSNPGGLIPEWMVNLGLEEGPIKTILNFKKILIEGKYSNNNHLAILN